MIEQLKEELQKELVSIHLGEIYQKSETGNVILFLSEKKEKQVEIIKGVIDDDFCPEDKNSLTDEDIEKLTSMIVIGLKVIYEVQMSDERTLELMHDLIDDFALAIHNKEYEEARNFEKSLQSIMRKLNDK